MTMDEYWRGCAEHYSMTMATANPINKVLYPYILQHTVNFFRVLDFGCGDGSLALLRPCQHTVYLYEESPEFLLIAKDKLKNRDAIYLTSPCDLADSFFDCVILNFVLMSLASESQIINILRQIKRTKTSDGLCLIVVTHPCFRNHSFSYYHTDYTNGKPFYYLTEGECFRVVFKEPTSPRCSSFLNYHHSISYYINLLIQLDYRILGIDELSDYSCSDHKYIKPPPYLAIRCA